MSTIHRFPPEVLQEVCKWLINQHIPSDTQDPTSSGLVTVAALARTSRIFHEHALNVLWRTIPNVALLLYTLPRDRYKRRRVKDHLKWTMFDFVYPLESMDFHRFRSYAARVKALKRDIACAHLPPRVCRYVIHPRGLRALEAFSEARRWLILPNLRELEYYLGPMPYTILRTLPCLCNPRLRCFNIKTYDSPHNIPEYDVYPRAADHQEFEEHITAMLARVQRISPELHEFGMGTNPSSVAIVNSVMDACRSFNHLTVFNCGETTLPLTFKALTHLALLPSLETLKFASDRTSWSFDDFWWLDHKPKAKTFPALRDLGMITLNVDLPIKVLPYVSSRHIKRVEIKVIHDVPRKQVRPLFISIAALKGHKTLKHVYVLLDVVRSDGNKAIPPDPICGKTLLPLLTLPHISRLQLDLLCPWDVDNVILQKMARCWPDLTLLELGIDRPWPHAPLTRTPRATFVGLMWLARECTRLETLGLEWNPDINEAYRCRPLVVPHVFTDPSPLQRMRVGYSAVAEGAELAAAGLLSNLFPQLREIEHGWLALQDAEDAKDIAERERVEREGGVFVPDLEREERGRRYEKLAYLWHMTELAVPECALIREQERTWNDENGAYERVLVGLWRPGA